MNLFSEQQQPDDVHNPHVEDQHPPLLCMLSYPVYTKRKQIRLSTNIIIIINVERKVEKTGSSPIQHLLSSPVSFNIKHRCPHSGWIITGSSSFSAKIVYNTTHSTHDNITIF